jgi:hypothetical protein
MVLDFVKIFSWVSQGKKIVENVRFVNLYIFYIEKLPPVVKLIFLILKNTIK